MEMKDFGIVFFVLCLGLSIGYLLTPEYISLEDFERNALIAEKDNAAKAAGIALEECWQAQTDAIVVEHEKCLDRIKDMAGTNRVLKADCVWAIGRVETAIADLNANVSDLNTDCNC